MRLISVSERNALILWGYFDPVIKIENPAFSEDAGNGDNCLNRGCVE